MLFFNNVDTVGKKWQKNTKKECIPDSCIVAGSPKWFYAILQFFSQGDKGKDGEMCNPRNVYLENVHWKKGGLLGTGAFSSCFEAMDFKNGRIMAVKQVSHFFLSWKILVFTVQECLLQSFTLRKPFTFLNKLISLICETAQEIPTCCYQIYANTLMN